MEVRSVSSENEMLGVKQNELIMIFTPGFYGCTLYLRNKESESMYLTLQILLKPHSSKRSLILGFKHIPWL